MTGIAMSFSSFFRNQLPDIFTFFFVIFFMPLCILFVCSFFSEKNLIFHDEFGNERLIKNDEVFTTVINSQLFVFQNKNGNLEFFNGE